MYDSGNGFHGGCGKKHDVHLDAGIAQRFQEMYMGLVGIKCEALLGRMLVPTVQTSKPDEVVRIQGLFCREQNTEGYLLNDYSQPAILKEKWRLLALD